MKRLFLVLVLWALLTGCNTNDKVSIEKPLESNIEAPTDIVGEELTGEVDNNDIVEVKAKNEGREGYVYNKATGEWEFNPFVGEAQLDLSYLVGKPLPEDLCGYLSGYAVYFEYEFVTAERVGTITNAIHHKDSRDVVITVGVSEYENGSK